MDILELGNEYANLVCAAEFGISKLGSPMVSNSKREKEIEDIWFTLTDESLQAYVDNALEDLEEQGFIKWNGKQYAKS